MNEANKILFCQQLLENGIFSRDILRGEFSWNKRLICNLRHWKSWTRCVRSESYIGPARSVGGASQNWKPSPVCPNCSFSFPPQSVNPSDRQIVPSSLHQYLLFCLSVQAENTGQAGKSISSL
jgi:hypothetical protein